MNGILFILLCAAACGAESQAARPRIIIETDAGGDPDDEQSLVRFLVYTNEFDVEGIIANRPEARAGENVNPVRDGLGIVRAQVRAYGHCHANLVRHDPRYPQAEQILARTVAGYDNVEDGVKLVLRAVDSPDPRPVWFCNWGTDRASGESCLKRALDRVRSEHDVEGYALFKTRVRLSSADKFGDHTSLIAPPFPLWVDTFRPPLDGKRWYHRFSALTARAGGFDIERDVRTGHGPLGALYPTNTGMPQKEGDTMSFLYIVPTGMNDPNEPAWGSWAGRYGPNDECPGMPYFWANQSDDWQGTISRDNTLARWAVALQNDFRARMDWCAADEYSKANHAPVAVLNGDRSRNILHMRSSPCETVVLSAQGSTDPDGNSVKTTWFVYREAGTHTDGVWLKSQGDTTQFVAPLVDQLSTIHVILQIEDNGIPGLFAFRRAVVTVDPGNQ